MLNTISQQDKTVTSVFSHIGVFKAFSDFSPKTLKTLNKIVRIKTSEGISIPFDLPSYIGSQKIFFDQ